MVGRIVADKSGILLEEVMGFRFRKSIKLLPGVRVNLSKSGTSLSVGGNGVTANLSKRGVKTTVGIPGSGLSYSSQSSRSARSPTIPPSQTTGVPWLKIAIAALAAVLLVKFLF